MKRLRPFLSGVTLIVCVFVGGVCADDVAASALIQPDLDRIDHLRADVAGRFAAHALESQRVCSSHRLVRVAVARDGGGRVRWLMLRQSAPGGLQAESVYASYDAAGHLIYMRLFRRGAEGALREAQLYFLGTAPFYSRLTGPLASTVSPRIYRPWLQPEALVTAGTTCLTWPVW